MRAAYALVAFTLLACERPSERHRFEIRTTGTCDARVAVEGVGRVLTEASPVRFETWAENISLEILFDGCDPERDVLCEVWKDGRPWQSRYGERMLRRWGEVVGQRCDFHGSVQTPVQLVPIRPAQPSSQFAGDAGAKP